MSRFFFDVVIRHTRRYDFHGRYLMDRSEAEQAAELVALDCSVSEDEDWSGAEVQVRDERGGFVLSRPIPAQDRLIA